MKGKKKVNLATILAALLIILMVGVAIFRKLEMPRRMYHVSVLPSQLDGWNRYINTKYYYSFMYPADLVLSYAAPGLGLDVPNEQTSRFEMRHPDVNETIIVNAIDYFAPRINMNQWEEISAEINGNSIEAYRNKRVEIDYDKLLFRFRDESKQIQVDFVLSYKDESELLNDFYGILSSFRFEN